METKIYKIKRGFARRQKLPIFFAGKILKETERAVYMYGKGTTETAKMGVCCCCGATLTHPVSVELGIGPICGGHHHDWDLVGGYSLENIKRLKQVVSQKVHVDGWVPKSVIKETHDTKDEVKIPADHKMTVTQNNSKNDNMNPTEKKAELVKYKSTGEYAIKISFPFDHATVAEVRTIPGRKFQGKVKPFYWTAPLSVEAVESLKVYKFNLDPKLERFLKKHKVNVADMNDDIDIPGLKGSLFPFQKKGVSFIEAKNGRALIGDEMGLGKTIQALAWLQLHPKKRPVIVVCPASLKLNWARETQLWIEKPNVQIISGTDFSVPIMGDVIIINYDILSNQYKTEIDEVTEKKKKIEIPYTGWVDYLIEINPRVLIIDEVHYTKNSKANRTKGVKKLGKNTPHVIALSGTPIINRPVEALNAIRLIDRTVVPVPWDYLHRYCGAKNNGFGWDFTGASNTEELHEKLTNTVMIRRLKSDVLDDLPDKIRSFVPIELDNVSEYNKAESNFITFIKHYKGAAAAERASNAETLTEIEGLKQLAVKGKLAQCIEWIRNFLEVDGKLVVFATHRFVIDALMKEFADVAVKVDGRVTGINRDKAVVEFQTNPNIRLFVGNIRAAGLGITLTAASNVAFIELPWTPGELDQAEDRCHRIGQKDSVTIHYLLADNSIEERIARLLDKKREVLDSVLDGKETESESLLIELMKEYDV